MLSAVKASSLADYRRLRRHASANPVVLLCAAAVVCAAPVLIWRIASELGSQLDMSSAQSTAVMRDLLIGLVLFALLAGLSIGNLVPGPGSVSSQIRVSPVPGRVLAMARAIGPLVLLGSYLTTLATVFLTALLVDHPNRVLVLIGAISVILLFGLTAFLAAHSLQAGIVPGLTVAAVAFLGWGITALVFGPYPWGVVERSVEATSVTDLVGVIGLVAVVESLVVVAWYLMALGSDDTKARDRRYRSNRLPMNEFGVHYVAAAATLTRRRDVRRHIVGVLAAAGLSTWSLSSVTAVGEAAALEVSLSLGMIGCAALILAAMAYGSDSPILWATTPGSPMARVVGAAAAGLVLAMLVYVSMALGLGQLTAQPILSGLSSAVGLAIVAAPAIVVGSLFPIRRDSGGDQYFSYVVLAAVALCWIYATSAVSTAQIWSQYLSGTEAQTFISVVAGVPLALLLSRQIVSSTVEQELQ